MELITLFFSIMNIQATRVFLYSPDSGDRNQNPSQHDPQSVFGHPIASDVRIVQATDAALIADISRQTFYDTFASENTPENMEKFMNTQFAREALMLEMNDPKNIFFLAYYHNEPAGYLKLRENTPKQLKDERSIELVRIYSVTSMIGKGIGKLLMQTAIHEAIKRDKSVVWLGVWEKNQRAIDFYTKWGFEKFGEHDFILGNDIQTDWLMKKYV